MFLNDELESKLKLACTENNYNCDNLFVEFSNAPQLADFQSNIAFFISKTVKLPPIKIAEQLACTLNSKNYENFIFSIAGAGFLNISLTNIGLSYYANKILINKDFCVKKTNTPKLIFLDYGGANIAKSLHMGHLRSPIIGEALNRLYRLLGHKTISDVHLGDWGLQMGLVIASLKSDGILDYYFKGKGNKPQITLDMLNEAYPKASLRMKEDLIFKKTAEDFTLFIQQGKQPYRKVFEEIKSVSITKIKQNYAQLNCYFDLWLGESDAEPFVEQTINIFKEKNLTQDYDGALIVNVAHEGENQPIPKKNDNDKQLYRNPMPPVFLKKSNGADLYDTSDLATIYMRNLQYSPDEIQYIVDERQGTAHFEKIFRAAKMSGISPENQILLHVGYGTMNGPDGKVFKTRDGGSIKLDDIINLVKTKAKDRLTENGIKNDDKTALSIGVAALKFCDLSNTVYKNYIFDVEKFCSFEGKTGPYIQYTGARIKSLLAKTDELDGKILINLNEEKQIVLAIFKFLDSFEACFKNHSLSTLCLSLYEICSAFSTFYNNIKILTQQNKTTRESYISLCKLVLRAIEIGLNTLAIDLPEKM
ncbi:MAG: arginine--tRNA ligase [Clostridia bacterium]